MLKKLLKSYIGMSLILNAFLIVNLDIDFLLIYFFNISMIVSYYYVLNNLINKPVQYYHKSKLTAIVGFYSFLAVVGFNTISYYFNQNYWVFSEIDAGTYHIESTYMASQSFGKGVDYFLSAWGIEDLGAVLVISSIYRVVESNLAVNFVYILLGVLSSRMLFDIGANFMSKRYAFIGSVAYSIASFTLWFHSSGLKESGMIFFIILFYHQFYKFQDKRKLLNLALGIFAVLAIMLYRPAISFLLIVSILLTLLYTLKRTRGLFVFAFALAIIFFTFFDYASDIFLRVTGGSTSKMIETKEEIGMVKGSLPFTYFVNFVGGYFGPLTTLVHNEKIVLTFYSPGLIFRILFSMGFWIGTFYALKNRMRMVLPLVFFVILESSSLIFILESLELRKSLPHFFAIFLVLFWYLDYTKGSKNHYSPKYRRSYHFLNYSALVFFFVIIYWNFRF
jgi:hypothetical protein